CARWNAASFDYW
nr:immunoglobulin heavy chain junction region [Macaca mulatta]MOV42724.1 immunoglobulin heavy chain junction region [Macaca mulatta]MOV44999.1 immunoglobulin heavy chain junction region [Macaca mulatta]MOV45284.1 immunoglobulin heavy chain junction region [Macaca mulatta]